MIKKLKRRLYTINFKTRLRFLIVNIAMRTESSLLETEEVYNYSTTIKKFLIRMQKAQVVAFENLYGVKMLLSSKEIVEALLPMLVQITSSFLAMITYI